MSPVRALASASKLPLNPLSPSMSASKTQEPSVPPQRLLCKGPGARPKTTHYDTIRMNLNKKNYKKIKSTKTKKNKVYLKKPVLSNLEDWSAVPNRKLPSRPTRRPAMKREAWSSLLCFMRLIVYFFLLVTTTRKAKRSLWLQERQKDCYDYDRGKKDQKEGRKDRLKKWEQGKALPAIT